ncbi:MAG: nicotinamide-nucleotide amidase [Oceanicoccus sp.]|jgi:nicotinamide-nucleotide amidase
MKIQCLLTGNELMSGHTVDSNSAMIAELLAAKAYALYRKVTVGDDKQLLLTEMESMTRQSDVLIVNGGLGPTIDDLTAEILSELTGYALQQHPIALAQLTQWCQRLNLTLNDANLKQALLPQGVEIIRNPTGSAPGFAITHNDCLIICTPGVPSELKLMMEQSIINIICQRYPNNEQLATLRFQTFGMGESSFQQLLNKEFNDWPAEVELGFRAGLPLLEIKLTIRNSQHAAIQQQCFQRLKQLIGDYIIGEGSCTLAEAVIQLLQKKKLQLTTAESCTGGLIASLITEVAGASAVFEAGIVSYSNRIKHQLLAVDDNLLEQYGAVSAEVVLAMAQGAMATSGADYAIAVSGIAGPDGGSPDKPVGTVWIAWGSKGALKVHKMQFTANRKWFQQVVAATTLDLLRRDLLGIDNKPRYFRNKKPR